MGDTSTYADIMDLIKMTPQRMLSSTGFALAAVGEEYLVYQPDPNFTPANALTVTLRAGDYSGEWFDPTLRSIPTPVTTMTVNLTGVADVQKITVTLSGVTDSFAQVLPDVAVSVNMLIGDSNGNKAVNAGDIAQTKAQLEVTVTNSANFRTDINATGTINAGDIALEKANAGHSVP